MTRRGCDARPDELVETLLADCEFGQRGDEMPRFAKELLVAGAFVLVRVLSGELYEAVDVGMLAEELGFGVKLDKEVKVLGEAAGLDAEAAGVWGGDGVGAAGREAREVADHARK